MGDSEIYRTALQVSPARIAALDAAALNELMSQLLRAQAGRCGSPRDLVNTETSAPDEGCDGWSDRPATPDPWLGSTDTCWQFKAGASGQPHRLSAEVEKPLPRRTLRNGGRFVVVASGSTNGRAGTDSRRERLTTAATKVGLSAKVAERIEVYGSEDIARWCNQHPAVAAHWAGRPPGLLTLDEWVMSSEHQMRYQASKEVQSNLTERRIDLAFVTGNIHHLHIQGPPGVGKTRFALELCRDAPWRDAVVYFQQSDDPRVLELIDSVAQDRAPEVRLMVVADEVQLEHLLPFQNSVERTAGRVRLVTVGGCSTPDPQRIPELRIEPLDRATMRRVINGWYPAMPPEHVDYVMRLSDGYLRLARLIANVVDIDRAASVPEVLHRAEIRQLLDRMLGKGDRRPLYVVAILTHVGWDGDREDEGEAIAEYMGLVWSEVRYTVNDFHDRMRIAPRGGRYRYISPEPLGIYLALEALDVYPKILESLPSALPSDAARDAYYKRLRAIASNPQARDYSRAELSFFFRIDDFIDARNVRRWSALSAADPETAARNLCRALTAAGVGDRRRIRDAARREIVWTLVRIAWRSSGFHDAVVALALLAEAENEPWGNNASHEFVARFQVFLGGTALPYLRRLLVIDELLESGRPELARLCVGALAQVGIRFPRRAGVNSASDQVPESEWRPQSVREHLECVDSALSRLETIAGLEMPSLQDDLIAAADKLSSLLRFSHIRVAHFFTAVRGAYPGAREPLRKIVARCIWLSRNSLQPDQRRSLEELHARLEERSLGARLRQHVGPRPWEREQSPDLSSIATEFVAAPGVLAEHWPWLTSGEASAAWQFGAALAKADHEGRLSNVLPELADSGPDLRIVCGYVAARREVLGDGWYERWVRSQYEREPRPVALIFEVIWRCGVVDPLAVMMAQILRSQQVSRSIVGRSAYGDWCATSADVLETMLRAMAATGHADTAVSILQRRIELRSAEKESWKQFALELVTNADLIRSRGIPNHYWQEVTSILVPDHFEEIAAAIFDAQARRDRTTNWFIEDESDVIEVLVACIEQEPVRIWNRLRHHLSLPQAARWFVIGFPNTVVDRFPADVVLAWIAERPAREASERAALLARLTNMSRLTDDALAARIIDEYGDREIVAEAFFSQYVSGAWSGPASSHWSDLAQTLKDLAGRTKLSGLGAWASVAARTVSRMAEQEQQREEERELLLR